MNPVIKIGTRFIGEKNPCFIIVEVGSNHNMDLAMAKELILTAAQVGADAVKFQSQKLEEQYLPQRESQDFINFFRKTELPEDWYTELAEKAEKSGIIFFSSPTYLKAVDLLEKLKVPLYKIASPQVATYPDLLEKVAQTGKPLILSTGMTTYDGLTKAVQICRSVGNQQFSILHCISHYPTQPLEVNLKMITTYRTMFGCPIGFSDHTEGHHFALASVALGASILEKHMTLDRKLPGPDHSFAIEPKEFAEMVRLLREVEAGLGDGVRLETSPDIHAFVEKINMRLVAKQEICPGTRLTKDLFLHRRMSEGIPLSHLPEIENLHAVAAETIKVQTPVQWHQIRFEKGKERS